MIKAKVSPSKKYKARPASLYLWCKPYDPGFVQSIKTLPLRAYDPDSKTWEVPMFDLQRVLKIFPSLYIEGLDASTTDIPEEYASIDDYEVYLNKLLQPVDYDSKTNMMPHQIEWFNMMRTRDRVLNADPMGLGKTKEYLDVCEFRKQTMGYKKCLFICGAKYTWNMAKQVKIHTNSSAIVIHGQKNKRLNDLRKFFSSDDYYLIIGYEAAGLHYKELSLLGQNMGFDACIIDECQKIKNYEVRKQVKDKDNRHVTVKIVDLVEYINPELVILGTGTPVSKKAEDLYSVLRLCKIESRSIWSFKKYFCQFDSWGSVCGYQNLDELNKLLKLIMIRRPKELLHLPEPRPEYMALRMGDKQRKFYTDCLMQLRSELKGTKAITAQYMTKLLRLRQITSNPILLDSDAPSIKEDIVLELVKRSADNGEKSIIYSIYVDEVNRLVEKLSSLNPAKVIGTMNAKTAQSNVDTFQEDPECMVLVGSLMACKESYDMWSAQNVYFLDQSYNWSDNDQAIARAWRKGQKNHVNIIILYCEGTVDESVFEVLINDKRLANQLVGLEGQSVRTFDPDLLEKLLQEPSGD